MITYRTSSFPVLLAVLLLFATLVRASAADTTYVRFNTNLGSIDVQMLSDEAPNTVANFLNNYVNLGAYNNSLIHRSVSGFIFQGGGYDIRNGQITAIPADAPVVNEFNVSNTRGTLAMAKLGSDPNSATNQWFFNEADNSSNLDNQNGGFTVFGMVANPASLAVMDAIAAVPIITTFSSPFDSFPLIDYDAAKGLQLSNFVFVYSIVPESIPTDATVTLGDLTATSTGQAQGVSVTTTPPGLATVITYSGGPGASPLLISNQDALPPSAATPLPPRLRLPVIPVVLPEHSSSVPQPQRRRPA